YKRGQGVSTKSLDRLWHTLPENAGMSSDRLKGIDGIINNAIRDEVMPGCQILVVRKGQVVFDKSYGNHTYTQNKPVENSDIYDLASITKVAATTLATMKLYEEGRLSITTTLSTYLPELAGTNKADLTLRELMTHQSGLQAWIPFYKYTLSPDGSCDTNLYCALPDSSRSVRVADRLYTNYIIRDSIYRIINQSELEGRGKFRYSDLGFIYIQKVIENVTGMPLEMYVEKAFYAPLGLTTMTYLPRNKFPLDRIIPTENDIYFRRQLIHGDVHDPAAAMMGGVAGHAGLFSNAYDLAILMQMMLNKGSYGGVQFLKPETITFFVAQQYEGNRKGLGWDKPPVDLHNGSPASKYASALTYGHTGFTGTCVWADPKEELIFIFLSNRVYPSAENNKLAKLNIRTDIHDLIYLSIVGNDGNMVYSPAK
ncbi:MAG: serine hydrolase, partial [Bacteroidota bacterium]|nr:serine hydrolase [Bacteroidota bacterium]